MDMNPTKKVESEFMKCMAQDAERRSWMRMAEEAERAYRELQGETLYTVTGHPEVPNIPEVSKIHEILEIPKAPGISEILKIPEVSETDNLEEGNIASIPGPEQLAHTEGHKDISKMDLDSDDALHILKEDEQSSRKEGSYSLIDESDGDDALHHAFSYHCSSRLVKVDPEGKVVDGSDSESEKQKTFKEDELSYREEGISSVGDSKGEILHKEDIALSQNGGFLQETLLSKEAVITDKHSFIGSEALDSISGTETSRQISPENATSYSTKTRNTNSTSNTYTVCDNNSTSYNDSTITSCSNSNNSSSNNNNQSLSLNGKERMGTSDNDTQTSQQIILESSTSNSTNTGNSDSTIDSNSNDARYGNSTISSSSNHTSTDAIRNTSISTSNSMGNSTLNCKETMGSPGIGPVTSVIFHDVKAGIIPEVDHSSWDILENVPVSHVVYSSSTQTGEEELDHWRRETFDNDTQTDLDVINFSKFTQTDVLYEECCKCGTFSLPVDIQVSNKLREEISQRITLENLVKIIEKEAVFLRQDIMVQTGKSAKLENTIFDLKAEMNREQHTSAQYKTKCEELQESLDGCRNMILTLEDQLAKTNYFKSGVDYMLESRLSESKAAEAQTKVEVLQEELLQAKQETQRLLDRLSEANRERREMVSGAVHMELLRISDEKAKDAELRAMQLENELHTLKLSKHNGHNITGSREKSYASYSAPSFRTAKSVTDHISQPIVFHHTPKEQRKTTLSSSMSSNLVQHNKTKQPLEQRSVHFADDQQLELPDVGSFSQRLPDADPATVPSIVVSFDKPLMVEGDSDSSDWSDDESISASPSRARLFFQKKDQDDHPAVIQPKIIKSAITKPKPPLPQKPKIAPKPGVVRMEKPKTVSLEMTSEEEKGVSFEESVHHSPLGKFSRTKGPSGRRLPRHMKLSRT